MPVDFEDRHRADPPPRWTWGQYRIDCVMIVQEKRSRSDEMLTWGSIGIQLIGDIPVSLRIIDDEQ